MAAGLCQMTGDERCDQGVEVGVPGEPQIESLQSSGGVQQPGWRFPA
jgi:hypothetical protein